MSLTDNDKNYRWISRCAKWRGGSELSGVNRQLTVMSAMWPINSIFFPAMSVDMRKMSKSIPV